ncbi:MAG: DJ-1/PfpI family protein [Oscillospiraceae bacterium]|jgi:4-methyl-5(b-hydroxyethyl)-thiazole monophosphate biosynthesis|nr:DJ-1/PfpI family protein [Oscillospiraceae bacterium]
MVYVLLANGFEDIEALTPVDMLRRAGIECKTVGIGEDAIEVESAHGITVTTDITEDWLAVTDDKVEFVDYDEKDKKTLTEVKLDMLILPGGMPGTKNLEESDTVQALLDYCVYNDKYIAAICAAPSILGHNGILQEKRATCYKGYETELDGATYVNEKVVVDDKIITSRSAGTALEFSLELVKILAGEEKYNKLVKSLLI